MAHGLFAVTCCLNVVVKPEYTYVHIRFRNMPYVRYKHDLDNLSNSCDKP